MQIYIFHIQICETCLKAAKRPQKESYSIFSKRKQKARFISTLLREESDFGNLSYNIL